MFCLTRMEAPSSCLNAIWTLRPRGSKINSNGMNKMDKPKPPNTSLHDKIKHLSPESQRKVLATLRELAPKHNAQVSQPKKG